MNSSTSRQASGHRNLLHNSSDSVVVNEFHEYDVNERKAELSIYCSYLQSLEASSGSASYALTSIEAFMHWGVIVEFKDGLTFTFDGNPKDGLLNGQFILWVKRGRPKKDIIQSIKSVGSVHCSPRELIARARKCAQNQTYYNLLFSNCQTWACQFCKDLSTDAGEQLPWNSSDVAVTGLTAVAVGGLLAWGVSHLTDYLNEKKKKEDPDPA